MAVEIAPLAPADSAEWEVLARGYKTFYRTRLPDEDYERAWRTLRAGESVHGLGARVDGRLVGIAHYLFHAQTWTPDCCYLQDLFTADDARRRGATRFYWLTREDNRTARALYDRIAAWKGFLRYDYPL